MDTIRKAKELMDNQISQVDINYIDFNGDDKVGTIEVNKSVSDEVKIIFDEIKESGFPIQNIEPIEKYGYSDEQSVRANNTSCYNFRFVGNTTKLSDHAIGLAIDINPWQNPWVHPSALNLTTYNESLKGTILKGSKIVEIFQNHGWTWGGNWRNPDYQHFFKGGELNKSIKNKLYDELGIDNPYLQQNQETPTRNTVGKFKDFMKNTYNKIVKESVKDLLVGPTEDEMLDQMKDDKPIEKLFKCIRGGGIMRGILPSLLELEDSKSYSQMNFIVKTSLSSASRRGLYDVTKLLLDRYESTLSYYDCFDALTWAKQEKYNDVEELLNSFIKTKFKIKFNK